MDQGRGFSIPLENGVTQNGSKWIPSTPDKPVLQRSNNSQSEVHQNQIGGETWQDLMDVYEDYLRNKQPHSFDLNSSEGLIYTKHNHESVPPVENYSRLQHDLTSTGIMGLNRNVQNSQDVVPFEAYNRLPFNLNPNGCTGANNLEHNTQNVSILQKFRSLNQNGGRIGSYVQNLGEVVPSQNMNSLSEFRDIMNDKRACSSKGSPDISTIFMAKPIFPSPVSQVGNNQVADTSIGMMVQQNHIWHERSQVGYATVGAGFLQHHAFHVNNDVRRYNQEGRPSFAKYNLNLTPRSEARESSRASRSTPLTPDQQKQLKTCWITQVPHLLIEDNSDPEEYIQECVVLPLEPEILEKDHCGILTNSMATSNAAFSTSPKDMKSSDGGNVEIDLNKTPQQKPPKRSKHRPKVIVEGKPKRSPKPSSAKSTNPDGTPPAKRKYVRRNDTKTSTPPTTKKVEVVKASQVIVEGTPDGTPLAKRKYVRRNDTKTSTSPTTEKVEVFKASQVIVEGEPKRLSRPSSSKSSNPDGTSSAKRKYVRRNDSKISTPPITEKVKVVKASQLGLATKSCKRKLNFDTENDGENSVEKEGEGKGLDYQEPENEWSKLPLNLNLNFHDAEWSRELNGPSTSAAKSGHHNTYGEEKQQSCSFFRTTNKISHQESMPPATVVVPPTSRDHTLNAIARSLNARNATVHHGESRYNQVHNPINRHLVFQENPSEKNMGFRAQSAVQTPHVLEDLVDVTDAQGTMPAYSHTMITSPRSITLMGSQLWPHGAPAAGLCNRDSSSIWLNGSETCKKKNVEDTMHGTSSSMSSGIRNIEEFIQQISNRMIMNLPAQSSTVFQKGESSSSDRGKQVTKQNANGSSVNGTCKQYINCTDIGDKFHQLHSSSQVQLYSENVVPKASHDSAVVQITKSLTTVTNRNLESAPNQNLHPIAVNRNVSSPLCAAVKKQTAGVVKCKKMPVSHKILQQEPEKKRNYGVSSKKVAEIRVEKGDRVSIDDITEGMKNLHITDSDEESVLKEQSALVPYKGDSAVVPYKGDGAVVPYAESDLVKRRNPRPRVDLDPETNRLWNLLMGKVGGESAETMDTNKEKWWEEERKVFRGRIDAFIARMHLVQGDRRFSKWKGSVVDSVIGVFLTQNVSDHLSSSAFMSLAAKFPLKSATARESYCEKGGSPSVGNQDVHVTYPDGTTFRQKMVKEPSNGHSSVTTTETSKHRANDVPPEEASLIYSSLRRTEEDIISSQSSSEYFIFQTSERLSSGSNSETEVGYSTNPGLISVSEQAKRNGALQQYQFQLKGSSYQDTTPLINHQQFGKSTDRQNPCLAGFSNASSYPFISRVQRHQSSVLSSTNSWSDTLMGMQNCEQNCLALLGTENISTLASKIARGKGAQCMDHYGESAESAFMVSRDGGPKFQTSSLNHAVPNKSFELLTGSLDESHYRNDQHLINGMNEKQDAFDWEGSISRDPRRPAEAFGKQPSDNGECIEVETEKARGQSSDKHSSKTNTTPSKAKKQKAEKKKVEQFNWDTLREQVHSKIGTTARSREATDSLDYEALRNADVREISDAIKERGMNNMLAERIKNFLNRIVQDHEKIDLEWLRDVEPDKSKDYLLSILGLGLKSVECVRLLTLRHLAFPVDTNVGRIAVRLGWVPLQPLPESLQLHLLELYPILETIQKYLWPRLCKLDQETLYELHYQMITFGKVFCTKREPNCNACPMRADCRHFASAFASARLALPGPQERHIVTSAAPISGKNSSKSIVKPLPLPPSKDTVEQGVRLSRDCEPVIEEPTTPEPPIEVEERDIEDAFYEDPDEIPLIKLNIEEFTTNLQSFIQEQIQTGEGDMCRALVALNPKLASIPSPKLKRTSRLRTEHRVYELPDSHPLLKGMDRREPDDPSPYLLAIWTPGETADSVQTEESKCSATEGGGLCHKETCFSCNTTREAQTQTVRGTILIPCRTAMRGSFPLNGTYFQVNEVFADHESSLNPIDVPRSLMWNLPRRTVFFGSSVSSIFKGLSTEEIQFCFWKGFVCVRGFEQKTRAPRPLKARLHLSASKMTKRNEETESKAAGKAKKNEETERKAAGKAKKNEETESKAAGKAKRNEETESKAAGKAKRNEETESKAAGKAKRNEETESKAAGKAKRKTSRL